MGKKGIVVAAGILAAMAIMSAVIAAIYTGLRVDKSLAELGVVYSEYWLSAAMSIGVSVAALALTTQILASTAIGGSGAWRNLGPDKTRRVAVLLFIGSWVLAIKVVILSMVGSMLGFSSYANESNIAKNVSCIAGVGIFMGAIILFLIIISIDIALYTLVQKGSLDTTKAVRLEKPPSRGTSVAVKY